MQYRACLAMMGLAWALVANTQVVYGDLMVDDFESYNIIGLPEGITDGVNYLTAGGDGSIHHIGPTWTRFGSAVTDGVFVSNRSAEAFSGLQGGTVFSDWSLGDQLSVAYLTSDMDVTTYSGYRIDFRSNGATGNQGAGLLATFSGTVDGQSQVWVTDMSVVAPQSVTGTVQTYEFAFDPSQYQEVNVNSAEADFFGTLSNLDWIGIQIAKEGSLGQEGFSFDNFKLIPEPTSAMLLVGSVLILTTHWRRKIS